MNKIHKMLEWPRLIKNVQLHLKSLNFRHKKNLSDLKIPLVNSIASIYDKNTVVFSSKKNDILNFLKTQKKSANLGSIKADNIIIATGSTPFVLDDKSCKGASKVCITSDDIFSLKKPPNKTLIVGGGYIGAELAGVISGLGYPVSLMIRGAFLPAFDRDISSMIYSDLEKHGKVRFIKEGAPMEMKKNSQGKINVVYKNEKKEKVEEVFDTVLLAIGRKPKTNLLNLEKVGVKLNKNNGKVIGGYMNEVERTNVPNIYAVGDALDKILELQPVASKGGKFLAKRVHLRKRNIKDRKLFDMFTVKYDMIPTTIFTPLEASKCGLTELEAIQKYGEKNIEVFLSKYPILEQSLYMKLDETGNTLRKKAFLKVICTKKDMKVVGIHFIGTNAGEFMQGFGVALKKGIYKNDLDMTFGIHPTTAEEITNLSVTKASGKPIEKEGCCT